MGREVCRAVHEDPELQLVAAVSRSAAGSRLDALLGLEGCDVVAAGEIEARSAVERLVDWSAPARAELGLDRYLVPLDRMLAEGNGAQAGVKQVIEMTTAAHLFFNPHTWSSAINTMAAIHLTATASNYIVFELKPLPSPLQYELVTEPIEQHGGWVTVPDKPGLGLEINEDVVRKYTFDSVP